MNKFITPLPSGGLPITNEDLLMIQNEAHDAITAVCAGMDAGFVLSGCVASQIGPNVSISAGYVFLDNQVMRFSGYEGIYPVYIKAGTPSSIQRVFKDGVSKNVTTDAVAVSILTPPLSGSYITFNPQPDKTLKSVVTSDEATARTAGDSALNSRITNEVNTLNGALNTKMDKASPQWQTATLGAGYGTYSGSEPQFLKDVSGVVHLRGNITTPPEATGIAFTLPEGYRPSRPLQIVTLAWTAEYTPAWLYVHPNGQVTFGAVNTSGSLDMSSARLDGVSFFAG